MKDDLEKALDKDLQNEFQREGKLSPVAQPRKDTLLDSWTKLETIEQDLRQRIRHERQNIVAEYERAVTEIKLAYASKIENTVAMLEDDRNRELRRLRESAQQKLRDHDTLIKRLED